MIDDPAAALAHLWAPALAFVAGFVSFASPCVLPLVPGYLSFVGGGVAAEQEPWQRRLVPILLFVAGFTIVFTLYGAFSSVFVHFIKGRPGQIVAGVVIIALGIAMVLYALGRGPMALFAERRPWLARARPGTTAALPLGMAFAAGWTPCIGPILGAILGIAAAGSATWGAFLLICYSLGLGIPFIVIGLGAGWLTGSVAWFQRHYAAIAVVSGSILVLVGFLVATGEFTRRVAPLANKFQPWL
jgi:cytochrome c-type biogenesis protein